MNTLVRKINDNLKNNPILKGRFYIEQISSQWCEYKDTNNANLWIVLRFSDRQTGKYWETKETVNYWRWNHNHYLLAEINKFIAEQMNVEYFDGGPQ